MTSWVEYRLIKEILSASHMVYAPLERFLCVESNECRNRCDKFIVLLLNELIDLGLNLLYLIDLLIKDNLASFPQHFHEFTILIAKEDGRYLNGGILPSRQGGTALLKLQNQFSPYKLLQASGSSSAFLQSLEPVLPQLWREVDLSSEISCGYSFEIPVLEVQLRRLHQIVNGGPKKETTSNTYKSDKYTNLLIIINNLLEITAVVNV